ncbi:MAG: dicarboxylate/amino acid:cation symporter [Rhodospirillaceae bacterium]|nr:dicarboxylate/amino acid:cation symporter [Rhodospirillaceae bacterium]
MSARFTLYIVLGMILGIVVGYICNENVDAATAKTIAGYFSILTDIFLRLIKMIIAPLVFSTLVVGIVHVGDTASLGRIGFLTVAWFLAASITSLTLGLMLVHVFEPGLGLDLPLPTSGADVAIKGSALTLKEFITHVFPKSFFEAMATNEILQIVVFSLFVGVAIASLGEAGKPLTDLLDRVVMVMLLITGYVMKVAPIAVFAAIAATITTQGLGILVNYVKFVGGFYISLVVLWVVLMAAGSLVIGRRVVDLTKVIREPLLLAFSTASSEAAYPKTLDSLQKFGVPKRIASFVLPLGYSFNLDGSMMYCTFATIFVAQAYGIDLTLGQQITMLFLLMVTSKGMAGVPRASLVVIAATLSFFGIPEEGLLLILAVDQFLDMGRSATNVVGNAVATAAVAKWEEK